MEENDLYSRYFGKTNYNLLYQSSQTTTISNDYVNTIKNKNDISRKHKYLKYLMITITPLLFSGLVYSGVMIIFSLISTKIMLLLLFLILFSAQSILLFYISRTENRWKRKVINSEEKIINYQGKIFQ